MFSNVLYFFILINSFRVGSSEDFPVKTKAKKSDSYTVFNKYEDTNCRSKLKSPFNGRIECPYDSFCVAECKPNYQFPNGENQLKITCRSGEWQIGQSEWTSVPNCDPICEPDCGKNGICIRPNTCECLGNYYGPSCEFEESICSELPSMINARSDCDERSCAVTCRSGFTFPHGSSTTKLICENGKWVPEEADGTPLQLTCEPVCSPKCQNGGICLAPNVCQCATDFRGPLCQYSVSECSPKKLGFNGGYKCDGDADTFSCVLNCPTEFSFPPASKYTCAYSTGSFQPQPVPQCNTGPDFQIIPLESNRNSLLTITNHSWVVEKNSVISSYNQGFNEFHGFREEIGVKGGIKGGVKGGRSSDFSKTSTIFKNSVADQSELEVGLKYPKPKTCFTWGGVHFKTFDGAIYSYDSSCAYSLVQDVELGTFMITIQNSLGCSSDSSDGLCHRHMKIILQEKEFTLSLNEDGYPKLETNNKILPIPFQLPELRVEMSAHFVIVFLDSAGINLKWDGRLFVQIKATELLWNRTGGLCGKMNGDPQDDHTEKDGKVAKNLAAFAVSWKVLDFNEICDDTLDTQHSCSASDVQKEASAFCGQLFADGKYAQCTKVIDLAALKSTCEWDYCSCSEIDRRTCACNTKSVYVRQCFHDHLTDSLDWRRNETCPIKCEGGSVYKSCGPKQQQTCGADLALRNSVDEPDCEEGCFCPGSTVFHEGKCISVEECPCRWRGEWFKPGSSVPQDCNSCQCSSGKWICTQLICSATCSVIGERHYITFDGKHYDFMGNCVYYLLKGSNYSVDVESSGCFKNTVSEKPDVFGPDEYSCSKAITIRVGSDVLKLNQEGHIWTNGEDVKKLPVFVSATEIRVASSLFLVVTLPNRIEVFWDRASRIYIKAPPELHGKTEGLCGTFTSNQMDDFLTPFGDVEQSVIPFVNKWKTNEQCEDILMKEKLHPCDLNPDRHTSAEKYCSRLKSSNFSSCHSLVEVEEFYENCKYDMCSCQTDLKKCLCPNFAAYGKECADKGEKIPWRNMLTECQLHCPAGQEYQICGSSCSRSCRDVSANKNCVDSCIEGCNCPPGQSLNSLDECVPTGECPCQFHGMEFSAGYREVRPGNSSKELCTCISGDWNCRPATTDEIRNFPSILELKTVCDEQKNLEATSCEPVYPKTCLTMMEPVLHSPTVCHAGCICKKGFVRDSTSGECVEEHKCPCYHGGKSYKEGSKIKHNCNTCHCHNSNWNCTGNICSGVCSAWGDSHFHTFDDKAYDFQGFCDYILAKGTLNFDSFEITIQNVPCGSTGVSCSKSIILLIGSGKDQETVTLTRGKPLPEVNSYRRISMRKAGLFVFLDVPDLGLVLQWDEGTRVYIKLEPKWKGLTKGLCGDYNDNSEDDFKTPSGGISEASARLFGDSWKKKESCPEPKEVVNTCELHPGRMIWATQQCSILNSDLFKPCHSEVMVEPYIERCVFDTCGCDEGGDCECFCTALGAYAHECNRRGIHIKWRSQKLCAMQCDEMSSTYSPCISTCPVETCDSSLTSHLCDKDHCVEGCEKQSCLDGQVYKNSTSNECIWKSKCKPLCFVIDGVSYFEGDKIRSDDCQTCFCSHGKEVCNGAPCPIVSNIPTSTEAQVHEDDDEPCDVDHPNQAHPTNCQLFYQCVPSFNRPVLVEKSCGAGTLYNPKTEICDWPAAVVQLKPECGVLPTTPPPTTANPCKDDEQWDECAVKCSKTCEYYHQVLLSQNVCDGVECIPGCVKRVCSLEKYRRDSETCVDVSECSCKSHNGKMVQPGEVVNESDCERCQCLNNFYTCDKSACLTTAAPIPPIMLTTSPPVDTFITVSTLSPGEKCLSENYISLINEKYTGKLKFNASSTAEGSRASFAAMPHYFTKSSSKSWQPEFVDADQWIEVQLPNLEAIYGVVVKGDHGKYVTSYRLLFSQDGHVFHYLLNEQQQPRIFQGPVDATTPVKQFLTAPIEAKYLKIVPQTWRHGIAIQLDVLGCNDHLVVDLSTEPTVTDSPVTLSTTKSPMFEEYITIPDCSDEMGLDKGIMSESQVSASSTLDKLFPNVKLSSEGIWRPLLDNPSQYLQFDFLGSRNLTGVGTKGANGIWTTAFKVFYKSSGNVWTPITTSAGSERIFLANVDDQTVKMNWFNEPIRAQYLRIQPVMWNQHPGLKAEVFGCFEPYQKQLVVPTKPIQQPPCKVCEGVLVNPNSTDCECGDLFWDGDKCTEKHQCPCTVDHLSYPVGTIFKTKRCEKCTCALNGVADCHLMTCEPCQDPNMLSTLTDLCECVCKPCPVGMKLCSFSRICINETFWCNGVKDCIDDETNCETKSTNTSKNADVITQVGVHVSTVEIKNVTTIKCEIPSCPPGYKVQLKKSQNVSHNSSPSLGSEGVKGVAIRSRSWAAKEPQKRKQPEKMEKELEVECQQFSCTPIKSIPPYPGSQKPVECPKVICPPNYKVIFESISMYRSANCPKYFCKPPPVLEAVCNVTGRTFNTFDNLEYKYDICSHILAREMFGNTWFIILEKHCKNLQSCQEILVITSDLDEIILYPDLQVKINGFIFASVKQENKLEDPNHTFRITRVGNQIYFISLKYNFWILWDDNMNVKVGLPTTWMKRVDGLCGYFDGNPVNDRQRPDGSLAPTSQIFGESWVMDETVRCDQQGCGDVLQPAMDICLSINDRSFGVCHSVIDTEKYFTKCLETTCLCLSSNQTVEACRCRALSSFASDCQSKDMNIDLKSWRNIHNCPVNCPAPLVFTDCFRNQCEMSCDKLQQVDPCPLLSGVCFPGCFCPEGLMRKGDTCIQPSECRDCVCKSFGNANFINYDHRNFTFAGNCTYVISRDVNQELSGFDGVHTFQILMTNVPCSRGICTAALEILYKGHFFQIEQPVDANQLNLVLDGQIIDRFPFHTPDILVTSFGDKEIKILIPAIQLEIDSFRHNFAFVIKLPSHIFGGAIEGLCGNCNGNDEDDFVGPNEQVVNNVDEFGLSWLATGLPQMRFLDVESCTSQKVKECEKPPPLEDPCRTFLNPESFGQCYNYVDPAPFIDSCYNTLCKKGNVCGALEDYARACSEKGLCFNWRPNFCPYQCPQHLVYKPCGPSCPVTCQTLSDNDKCLNDLVEGCFCPMNFVLHNATCIPAKSCFVCDDEGHVDGDVWQPDKCTTCSCTKKTVTCDKTECPMLQTVCQEGFTPLPIPSSGTECCQKYICAPVPTTPPTCPELQQLECGYGQVMKLSTDRDGCQKFICECIPPDNCLTLIESLSLEPPVELMQPGMVQVMNNSGCCPRPVLVCKPETCPKASECPEYHVRKVIQLPDLCCPQFQCEISKDVCFYTVKQRRLGTESRTLVKNIGDTWNDGACISCVCERSDDNSAKSSCTTSTCPAVEKHPDFNDFILEEVSITDQCCPDVQRVACRDQGAIYNVGETWKPDANDICLTVKCENVSSSLQKKSFVQECNVLCEKGYEYVDSKDKSVSCCGDCVPVACVFNENVKKIGDSWQSDDFCINYQCISVNQSVRVKETTTPCPPIPSEEFNDYEIETEIIPGVCCPKYVRTGCKSGGITYRPGLSWRNDENVCVEEKCAIEYDKIQLQRTVQSCNTTCELGWEYEEPEEGTCCGKCKQMFCIEQGILHQLDSTWHSPDNCTTFECQKNGDQLTISRSSPVCPDVSDCQPSSIFSDGCCQKCKLTSVNSERMCIAEVLELNSTIGIFEEKRGLKHGICRNLSPIDGLTECHGFCQSSHHYQHLTGIQVTDCKCCQPLELREIKFDLTCDDGKVFSKKIYVPTSCSCNGCEGKKFIKKTPHIKSIF